MKVEYLDDLTDGGKFKQVVSENLIRLYDFDEHEALKFKDKLQETIVQKRAPFELSIEPYIEAINCSFIFRLSENDIGISSTDKQSFYCDLTLDSYIWMVSLLEPFSDSKAQNGFQWLYELDNPIDLLFSPGGTW